MERRIINKGYVTNDDVIHFEALCTSILSGMSSFTVIQFICMSREKVDNLVFNGQALMIESDKRLTVGVISEPDKEPSGSGAHRYGQAA